MTTRISLVAELPPDLFHRFAEALRRQGSPEIAVRRDADSLLVEGETSELMLRCRAITALEDACDHDGWQRFVRL